LGLCNVRRRAYGDDPIQNQSLQSVKLQASLGKQTGLLIHGAVEQRKHSQIGELTRDYSHFLLSKLGLTYARVAGKFLFLATVSGLYRVETDSGVNAILPIGLILEVMLVLSAIAGFTGLPIVIHSERRDPCRLQGLSFVEAKTCKLESFFLLQL
jgi:hypothetical protein